MLIIKDGRETLSNLLVAHITAMPKPSRLDSSSGFAVMRYVTPPKDLTSLGIIFLIAKKIKKIIVEIEDDNMKDAAET